jgi:hypothetical protein
MDFVEGRDATAKAVTCSGFDRLRRRTASMGWYKNKSDSISRIVRCELRCRAIIKASPDMPPKMLACQRSLTKYSHEKAALQDG